MIRSFILRAHWSVADYIAGVLAVGLLLTAFAPTHWFIRPVSYSIENGFVTFHRETPFGGVWASWDTTIIRLDGSNLECNDSGFTDYQEEPLNFVQYPLSDRMLPCVQGGAPFKVKQKWRVWAGYSYLPLSVPLRPYSQTFIIE